jgi:DNA-binding CsgD family transcriptional regulator
VDANGEMVNLYAERMLPPDAMAAYYERHYQKTVGGFAAAFRRRAESDRPVSSHTFSKEQQRSDYFRDVMDPLDACHILYGVLRDGGRAFAQISFYRGKDDRPFDSDSATTLGSLLRYLSTGLSHAVAEHAREEDSNVVEEGVGIVGLDGQTISAPDSWMRMLRLAALSEVSPRNARKEGEAVEDLLQRICARLTMQREKTTGAQLTQDSAWGRFSFKAYRLPDRRARRADQVAVLIRREELQALSLVRGTGGAPLSAQQREAALLLAQGKSNREIAEKLALSLNTANYHVKQVFAKLEVNERGAVAGKLLRLAQAAAGC